MKKQKKTEPHRTRSRVLHLLERSVSTRGEQHHRSNFVCAQCVHQSVEQEKQATEQRAKLARPRKMQKTTQQLSQMADSAASSEFLRSCQFDQASRPSGFKSHIWGITGVDSSSVTQTHLVSNDNALQNRAMTAPAEMCGKHDGSRLECSRSQTSKPQQQRPRDASDGGVFRQHPPAWNHRHKEQERNPQSSLQQRLTGETAISPQIRATSQDSQASRVELLQSLHPEVQRHQRNEVERTEQHKLDRPSALLRSLQRAPFSNSNFGHDSSEFENLSAALMSFDAAWLMASTEALQAVKRKSLTGKASSRLHQGPAEGELRVKRKEPHKMTTTAVRNIVDRPRDDYKQTSQHLPTYNQELQTRSQNEGQKRQQIPRLKLHRERPSHNNSGVVFTVGQNPQFALAMASRIDSLKHTEKPSQPRRRLHQKLEEQITVSGSGDEPRRPDHQRSSSATSTDSQSVHGHLYDHTGTEVADAAIFTAASSSAKRLNTTTGADATVVVAVKYPAPPTKQAHLLQASPQAQPHPSESGHLLPAKLQRKQAVESGAIPGTATERADAFYFAAAAIGCSALLCVAGFILLLAIFRSYRLRQQKHEAAKQLIRKIHCSAELPTRELVVQYSRELRSQTHKYNDERNQKRAHPFWNPPSSIYFTSRTPEAPTVVLHPGHQRGEDIHTDTANIKASVRTRKGARNGEGDDKVFHTKGFNEGHCSGGAPEPEDRNAHSSQIMEAKSEVITSRQAAETLNAEGAADAQLSVDVSLNEQQAHGKVEPHDASKVGSARRPRSSTVLKHVTTAAAGKGNTSHVTVKGCRQNPSSTDGALVAVAGPRGTNPSGVPKDTLLSFHTHTYKHEVRLAQPQKRVQGGQDRQRQQLQPENDEQPQCSSKRRHCNLKHKASCDVGELGRISLDQRSPAAPDGSVSLFQPALSISHHFPRSLFMTNKKQHKVRATGSQQGAPSSCHAAKAGQKPLLFNGKICASSCPGPARVLYSPHDNADGKSLLPGVSASACRLAYLLHRSPRTNSSSAKSGDSRRSGSPEFSITVGTDLTDERGRHSFFSCGRRRTGGTSDCHYRDNSDTVFTAQRSQEERLPSFLDGERAVQTPPDAGEKLTWVSEVSDGISCSHGTKNTFHNERSNADGKAGAADNSSSGGVYSPSRTTASEWNDSSNTEIPTHMMTTAVNNEEEECSETATNSNEEIIENDDDAIVEFDTANVSLEIEDAVHSRQTTNTDRATVSRIAATRTT